MRYNMKNIGPSGRETPSSTLAMTPAYLRTLAFRFTKFFEKNCWLSKPQVAGFGGCLGNGTVLFPPDHYNYCFYKFNGQVKDIRMTGSVWSLRFPYTYIFWILLSSTLLLTKGSRFCLNNPENHSLYVSPLLLFWYLITLERTPSQGVLNQKKRQERSHQLR